MDLRNRAWNPKSFADGVAAFYHLVEHPELTWKDLLDGLGHAGMIADEAVIQLHLRLNIPDPEPDSDYVTDREHWEKILSERRLDQGAKAATLPPDSAD